MENKENEKKVYVCLNIGCRKEFMSKSGRSKHHNKCTKKREQKEKGYTKVESGLQCKVCEKIFSDHSNIRRHIVMTHSNRKKPAKQKKIHKCQVCNKEFTGPAKLERQEKVHGNYHDCGYCGRRFKRIDNFHKHACLTNAEGTNLPGPSFIPRTTYDTNDSDMENNFDDNDDVNNVDNHNDDDVNNVDNVDVEECVEDISFVKEDLVYDGLQSTNNDNEPLNPVDVEEGAANVTPTNPYNTTNYRKASHLSSILKKIITTNMDPDNASGILKKKS